MGSFWIAPLNRPISMPSGVAVGCVLDARYEILAVFLVVIPWEFHGNSGFFWGIESGGGHKIRGGLFTNGPATIAEP